MISLPSLNDQQLNTIIENAVDNVKTIDGGWNPMSINDPGIFLLELMASIKYNQQKDIDFIGIQNFYKFLKLLGIKKENGKCAKTDIEIISKEDVFIPKGTKFKTGNIVFETLYEKTVLANDIKFVGNVSSDYANIAPYTRNELSRKFEIFQECEKKENCFIIGFEKELSGKNDLYFEIYDEIPRTPIKIKNEFIPLSKNLWQYYGIEDGVLGWHDLDILNDETLDFLYSGYIYFDIKGKTVEIEAEEGKTAHFIRAKNLCYGYEKMPVAEFVKFNSVKLVQKDTLAETIKFTFADFKQNQMFVKSYLAYDNTYMLYIKSGDDYVPAESLNIEYVLIKDDENVSFRFGTSNREKLYGIFENNYDEDVVFMLVLYKKEFYPKRVVGSGNGSTGQEFQIKDFKNVCYEDFNIMVSYKDQFNIWKKTDDFEGKRKDDKVFIFNPNECSLLFGDNISGKAPSVGKDNIIITSFATSSFDDGNLKSFMINEFDKNIFKQDMEILQFKNSYGGKKEESSDELVIKVRNEINRVERAVTLEDYEKIALGTQGLKIKNVEVIAGYNPETQRKCENSVMVVIEPFYKTKNREVIDRYIRNVKRNLEKVKLITTRLFVTVTECIPININLEIRVNNIYKNAEKMISSAIADFMGNMRKNKAGFTIFYTDIYNIIEALDCVDELINLEVEFPYEKITKNNFGDIKISPQGRVFLQNINTTFI